MHHTQPVALLVDLIACRLAPQEREIVRRRLHAHRRRCLLRFGHGVRADLERGGHTVASAAGLARAAVALRAAELGWRDELALVAGDALERHDARTLDALRRGMDRYDASVLLEALARDVLRGVDSLLGLSHASSAVPAIAVRATFDCLELDAPCGAAFVALLDRLGDVTGRRALEYRAARLVGTGTGLSRPLACGLVGASVRADGFEVDGDSIGEAIDRAVAEAACRALADDIVGADR